MTTCGVLILGAANAVTFGLGVWWSNTSLLINSTLAAGGAVVAWVLPENSLARMLAWFLVGGMGAWIVLQYRTGGGQFLWQPDLGLWDVIPGVSETVGWVLDILRAIPEGVAWTNLFGGAVFGILETLGWAGGGGKGSSKTTKTVSYGRAAASERADVSEFIVTLQK